MRFSRFSTRLLVDAPLAVIGESIRTLRVNLDLQSSVVFAIGGEISAHRSAVV